MTYSGTAGLPDVDSRRLRWHTSVMHERSSKLRDLYLLAINIFESVTTDPQLPANVMKIIPAVDQRRMKSGKMRAKALTTEMRNDIAQPTAPRGGGNHAE